MLVYIATEDDGGDDDDDDDDDAVDVLLNELLLVGVMDGNTLDCVLCWMTSLH